MGVSGLGWGWHVEMSLDLLRRSLFKRLRLLDDALDPGVGGEALVDLCLQGVEKGGDLFPELRLALPDIAQNSLNFLVIEMDARYQLIVLLVDKRLKDQVEFADDGFQLLRVDVFPVGAEIRR
jgi:hypothetical protein